MALSKEDIKDILHQYDYIDETNFSMLNNPLMDTPIGESDRLKKAYETFIGHWWAFRKEIETEPTSD